MSKELRDCYCVCHSSNSSCSYCEHCKGINEVGAVHNPVLKALIAKEKRELVDKMIACVGEMEYPPNNKQNVNYLRTPANQAKDELRNEIRAAMDKVREEI